MQRLSRHADVRALEPEWRVLYEQSRSRNPYACPEWVIAWLEHLVREPELAVVAVRRDGRLVGVAPCYQRTVAPVGRVPVLRTVQLAGTVRFPALTELPQVLAAPGETRSVLRAVLGEWRRSVNGWDWLELPLDAGQGWFEPQWLGEGGEFRGLVQHKTTRAAVVLTLRAGEATDHASTDGAASVDGAVEPSAPVRDTLKRNVWESVKRARNRLDKSGSAWAIAVYRTPEELVGALPELRRLHAARAATAGRRTHPDILADPAGYAFFADAISRMAARGRIELLVLESGGAAVAAQLVLRAPDAAYLALSGVDPRWWHAGPVTLLQYTAVERAAARGDGEVNFSVGPDVSKLRWSDHVVQHPEFVVCGTRARSRLFLSGYAAAAAVAAVRREAGRHRTRREEARGSAREASSVETHDGTGAAE